jgi:uncharacterized membrane protein
MKTAHALLAGLGLTLGVLLYSLVLYPSLPELIPVHWNWRGEVDGWAPKEWAAFLGPAAMGVGTAMIWLLPWLSPGSFSVAPFRRTANYILVLVVALMGYLHLVALRAALHPDWASGRVLVAGIFLFLALLGNVLGKVRRNFWMGIRTPWTLASDRVWIATHRLAARLLLPAGLLGAVLLPLGASPAAALFLVCAALLIPAAYSFFLYRRLEQG